MELFQWQMVLVLYLFEFDQYLMEFDQYLLVLFLYLMGLCQ